MRSATGHDQHSCLAGCSDCGPNGESVVPDALPVGWVTATVSMAAFLLPLVFAILGAVVLSRFWEGVGGQVVGAAAGLMVGVAAAMLLVRIILVLCPRNNAGWPPVRKSGQTTTYEYPTP